MKKTLFLFLFCATVFAVSAQEADTVDTPIDIDSIFHESEEIEAEEIETEADGKEYSGSNDSTLISPRQFEKQEVQRLKDDSELQYEEEPTVAENLWTRFLAFLQDLFQNIMNGATSTNIGRTVLIIVGIGLVVFLILMVLKIDAFRMFYSGADSGKVTNPVFHENIHEMDFEQLIREAKDKGEYRLGVRLIFLYALKTLSDKHLIDWKAGKTNHDYVNELQTNELKTGLNELSFYFDYAWYGGFNVNQDVFQKVDGVFRSWKAKVN